MIHARKDYTERIQDSENKIPKDEPVFLLRAQDVLFIPVLLFYLSLYRQFYFNDYKTVRAIEEHIKRSLEWQNENQIKTADV